jgi:hypothetical protein
MMRKNRATTGRGAAYFHPTAQPGESGGSYEVAAGSSAAGVLHFASELREPLRKMDKNKGAGDRRSDHRSQWRYRWCAHLTYLGISITLASSLRR